MFPFLAEFTDDGIGERFPAYVAVGSGFVCLYLVSSAVWVSTEFKEKTPCSNKKSK